MYTPFFLMGWHKKVRHLPTYQPMTIQYQRKQKNLVTLLTFYPVKIFIISKSRFQGWDVFSENYRFYKRSKLAYFVSKNGLQIAQSKYHVTLYWWRKLHNFGCILNHSNETTMAESSKTAKAKRRFWNRECCPIQGYYKIMFLLLSLLTCWGTKRKKHPYAQAWVKHPFSPMDLNPVIRLLPTSPRVWTLLYSSFPPPSHIP